MTDTIETRSLTYEGARKIVAAAVDRATEMGVPQCISVVDPGGHLLACARMDGAFYMSLETSLVKAQTAACYRRPTGWLPAGVDIKLAIATQGKRVDLPGGLPIIVEGKVIGAIGVGSGTGEEDREVAKTAVATVSGAQKFD